MPSPPQELYAPAPRDRRTQVYPTYACAVGEQPVRAPALAHARRAWHGPYIASGLEGVPGRYEGPAVLGGLDDHHSPGKAGYEAVPGRESPCQGRLAEVV